MATAINAAGVAALSPLHKSILAHCIERSGVAAEGCTVTPCGILATSDGAARAVYAELVYGYGIDIFTAFVTGRVSPRKYEGIADFVDTFATQIEYSIGLKKGGLAQSVRLEITE